MINKPSREQILALLDAFVRQRAGLEFGNYGDVRSYRAEQRSITRDLHDYRAIRSAVEWSSLTANQLLDAFRAFSGRLSISEGKSPGTFRLDYCTGQYFPTEYRRAACAVLARALWEHRRDNSLLPDTDNIGERLHATFRKEFGARLARRWFS